MTMFVTRRQEDVQGAVPQDGLRTFVTEVRTKSYLLSGGIVSARIYRIFCEGF